MLGTFILKNLRSDVTSLTSHTSVSVALLQFSVVCKMSSVEEMSNSVREDLEEEGGEEEEEMDFEEPVKGAYTFYK